MPNEINVSLPGQTSGPVGSESSEADLKNDMNLLGEEEKALAPETEETESETETDKPEAEQSEAEDEQEESSTEESEEEGEESDEETPKKSAKESEEEPELVRHSYGDIKAKYPSFFKDFPGLKTAFFREQEFSKIFPSLEEAKDALEVKDRFDNIKDIVFSGDVANFLKQVPESSRAIFAENFLPDLFTVDKESYYAITTPVIQNIFSNVFKAAAQKRDNNLGNAAILAYQEIFGGELEDIPNLLSKGIQAQPRQAREEDPERIAIRQERESLNLEKRITLQTAAWSEVQRDLTREIEKGLDPNNAIRPGLKKIIVDKIFNEVVAEVAADAAHVKRMDDLWERERKAGYRGAFKGSLKNTYLSRAKAIIPRVRQKIRSEIAGSQKSNDKALGKKVEGLASRRDVQPGKVAKPGTKITSAKDPAFKKMSDLDFLSR